MVRRGRLRKTPEAIPKPGLLWRHALELAYFLLSIMVTGLTALLGAKNSFVRWRRKYYQQPPDILILSLTFPTVYDLVQTNRLECGRNT